MKFYYLCHRAFGKKAALRHETNPKENQYPMKEETTDNLALLRSGEWLNGYTTDIFQTLTRCEEKCFELNSLPPSRRDEREQIVRELFGNVGEAPIVHSPFHCDFGMNIHIGDHFVGNFHLTILDEAEVRIGNHVFIGPNTSLCTIVHAFDAGQRNAGIMRALPIRLAKEPSSARAA